MRLCSIRSSRAARLEATVGVGAFPPSRNQAPRSPCFSQCSATEFATTSIVSGADSAIRPTFTVTDRLRSDPLTPHSPEPAYASEDRNRADTRDCRPIANHPLRPGRDRNSPDMFSLADQVGDDPMSFRICRSSILRPTSLARRSPQPIRNARIARSRLPRVISYGKPCTNVLD